MSYHLKVYFILLENKYVKYVCMVCIINFYLNIILKLESQYIDMDDKNSMR